MLFAFLLAQAALAGGYALRTVRSGDSLGAIAVSYRISVEALMAFNGLRSDLIHPGQVLRVPYIEPRGGPAQAAPKPPPRFRLHTLAPGETISHILRRYDLTVEVLVGANPDLSSLDRLPAGLELLIPPGPGLVVTLDEGETILEVMARYDVDPVTLARANELRSPQDLRPGRLLFIPDRVPEEALTRLAKVREIENTYIWPVHGRITSYFGRRSIWIGGSNFHPALDIAAPTGTAVLAARAGTVSFAGWSNQGYGYLVILRHAGGAETWYAHNSHLLVSAGQRVEQGAPIARVGSTGFSTGPHLHFELRENGKPVDPLTHLR
jgi:murein DD-endopeptidase MepM/ murein hydrolase activator NlpD